MKISIKNLSKKFSNKEFVSSSVLRGINLDINNGDILSIIGANGSGKTTLLNIIADRLAFNEGAVEYDLISKDSIKLVNANDRSFFWNLTVRQNLNFFSPGFDEDLKKNKLIEIFDIMKNIDNKYSSLSSGEKKKIIIFRSIISGGKVLVLDEFTNSLDHVTKNATYKLIKDLIKNDIVKIIIFVTHDINEVLSLATRCVVLKNGLIEKDIEIQSNLDHEDIKVLMEC